VGIAVFLGAPGSGKGTQAKRLADTHGFKHFSTGDMLRASIKEGRPVGAKAKTFMDKGELVPDTIMIELIEDALCDVPSSAKVILDGFPRTVPQAEALDKNAKTKVSQAVYFKMPEDVLIKRLTGRRICSKCSEPFHTEYMRPKKEGICDKCGSSLIQRPDDVESVVRKRLEVFNSQNLGLLSYYRNEKKLGELNGDQEVNSLQSQLLKML
jgi:adenylate kinase